MEKNAFDNYRKLWRGFAVVYSSYNKSVALARQEQERTVRSTRITSTAPNTYLRTSVYK